jgi:hypothetical protein
MGLFYETITQVPPAAKGSANNPLVEEIKNQMEFGVGDEGPEFAS